LYRIPGLGVRNANRIVGLRRHHALRVSDLMKLRVNIKKCLPFMICLDHHPARLEWSSERLRAHFAPPPEQLELSFGMTPIDHGTTEKPVADQAAGVEAQTGEF